MLFRSAEMKKKIARSDMDAGVECLNLIPVRPFSGTGSDQWDRLKECIVNVWGDVIVSPYLMIACSDSRHYTDICENVYKFSPIEMSSEERKMIHGHNERIPIAKLHTIVRFFEEVIRRQ